MNVFVNSTLGANNNPVIFGSKQSRKALQSVRNAEKMLKQFNINPHPQGAKDWDAYIEEQASQFEHQQQWVKHIEALRVKFHQHYSKNPFKSLLLQPGDKDGFISSPSKQ